MLHDWCALSWEGGILCPKFQIANLGVYGGFLLILMLFTGNFRISGVVTYVMSMAFGLAVYYTMMFRGVALCAGDMFSLSAAKEVAGSYDYSLGTYQWIGVAIGIAGIIFTILCRGKLNLNWKRRVAMALIGIMLALGLYAVYFKWEKFSYVRIKLFSPHTSYQKYGTAYGFVRSFSYLIIEKPEGYSVEEVEKIADTYIKKAEAQKNAIDKEDRQYPNVIVIMDETLCDLQNLGPVTFETNKDVLPNLHGLSEDTQKADLHVSRIGGGTAIMEFEMLTGNTNLFLPYGTIAYQTLIKDEHPSLASQLKNAGYDGIVASHPHRGAGYNRINAYPFLGFKETKFIENLGFGPEDVTIGQYPSDEASFNEIIAEYEAENKRTEAPFFAFQVTMQNHTPYFPQENPEIKVKGEFADYPEFQDFLNYMHETDRAFGVLKSYFEECEEPTIVAIFGDHPPRFGSSVFAKLMGVDYISTMQEAMMSRKTPLYIWANYDIEEKDLGITSTNFVSDYIVKIAGVPETGYQMFLSDLHKDVTAINALGYLTKDGEYYQSSDKESPYWKEVNDYKIIQYNNLIDTKNRISGFFE